jgi:tRNA nucleotidyltransferase (CCA-adding enzyme)
VTHRAPLRDLDAALAPEVRAALHQLAADVDRAGGRALAVGGCVRDALLGRRAADVDVEVHGVPPDRLEALLTARFRIKRVGRAFPVYKLAGLPIDLATPRRDSRPGGAPGERAEPAFLTPEEAAARRDFTINAIALDLASGECIDPFAGRADLGAGVLRHVSGHFGEDPLRVLRGMQLCARFELRPAAETRALCASLSGAGLPRERVFEEWRKLLVLGVRPSLGLGFLRDCDWLRHHPEIAALVGCPQDPAWHPEGDVWVHTLHCLDAFAEERVGDAREDLVVGLAVLCHDLGKPETTRDEGGHITSQRHERAGEARTREFLARLTGEGRLVEEVAVLVANHLRPVQLYEARAGDAAIRRLARRVGRIDRLVRVARADQRGRPPRTLERFAAGEWLLARARALDVARSAPERIVKGRHLRALGLAPGPELGALLDACYRAQLEGRFASLEEGIEFARARIAEAANRRPTTR